MTQTTLFDAPLREDPEELPDFSAMDPRDRRNWMLDRMIADLEEMGAFDDMERKEK